MEYRNEIGYGGSEDSSDVMDRKKRRIRSVSSTRLSNCENRGRSDRRPTRLPNPKISNRNALMARENRKKKKEYLEQLEDDLERSQIENTELLKIIRRQSDLVRKLTKEKLYLRSVLANKSDIIALLKNLRSSPFPCTSSIRNFVVEHQGDENQQPPVAVKNGLLPSGIKGRDAFLGISDPFLSASLFNENLILAERSFKSECLDWQDEEFCSIKSEQNSDDVDTESLDSAMPCITEDENEDVELNDKYHASIEDSPGVCIHLSKGKISLEFCATCHEESKNAWDEEF